jgi:hypothetical protein
MSAISPSGFRMDCSEHSSSGRNHLGAWTGQRPDVGDVRSSILADGYGPYPPHAHRRKTVCVKGLAGALLVVFPA